MRSIFHRDESDSGAEIPREAVEARLPASVRSPEKNRFTPLGSDAPPESDDTDLEFLAEIARAAEADVARPRRRTIRPAVQRVTVAPEDDGLNAFREMAHERERKTVSSSIHVDDVDLVDLMEDLTTTAAALRKRRAA
jgi:hypothetical protein